MKKLLINHQWNKCASQSIKKSLKQQIKHIKLFDSHHRTEDIRHFLYGDKKISAHKGHSDQFHLNKDFDSYKKYTVCVIRDPYNRWLSGYFQRLLKPKKKFFEKNIFEDAKEARTCSIESAMLNLQQYDFKDKNSQYINFLENEFNIFDINLYNSEMYGQHGYTYSNKTNTSSVFLRLEHSSDSFAKKIMNKTFGVDDWTMLRMGSNAMSDLYKNKNFTYKDFTNNIRLAPKIKHDIIEFYSNHRFCKYFFSDTEINTKIEFIEKIEEIN